MTLWAILTQKSGLNTEYWPWSMSYLLQRGTGLVILKLKVGKSPVEVDSKGFLLCTATPLYREPTRVPDLNQLALSDCGVAVS